MGVKKICSHVFGSGLLRAVCEKLRVEHPRACTIGHACTQTARNRPAAIQAKKGCPRGPATRQLVDHVSWAPPLFLAARVGRAPRDGEHHRRNVARSALSPVQKAACRPRALCTWRQCGGGGKQQHYYGRRVRIRKRAPTE